MPPTLSIPEQPKHLLEGLGRFYQDVFPGNREKWARLAEQQHPSTLFITCADSRIDPSLLTQSGPGELFICLNPGNLVPPYGVEDGGVATTAEYAIDVLHVRHAIVCGHSDCGGMRALSQPEAVSPLPAVSAWLRHARTAKRIHEAAHASTPDSLRSLTEDNILAQLTNLRTYPTVAAALAAKTLTLHD